MNLGSAASANLQAVPRSSRQLITGWSANQSIRAVNLPAVRVKPADCRYSMGGPDARVMMGTDEAPLVRLRREKRGDVEPEDLSNRRWYEANTGQVPTSSNIGALFYATAVFFLGWLPRNSLLILLWFLSKNKRLRLSALDKASSNQLVRSRTQEKLR
jgi:hypothetical protein